MASNNRPRDGSLVNIRVKDPTPAHQDWTYAHEAYLLLKRKGIRAEKVSEPWGNLALPRDALKVLEAKEFRYQEIKASRRQQ